MIPVQSSVDALHLVGPVQSVQGTQPGCPLSAIPIAAPMQVPS